MKSSRSKLIQSSWPLLFSLLIYVDKPTWGCFSPSLLCQCSCSLLLAAAAPSPSPGPTALAMPVKERQRHFTNSIGRLPHSLAAPCAFSEFWPPSCDGRFTFSYRANRNFRSLVRPSARALRLVCLAPRARFVCQTNWSDFVLANETATSQSGFHG